MWRVAESLKALREQINAAYPGRDKSSDGAIGDAAHATRNSDHNPWVKDRNGVGVVTAIDTDEDLSADIHSIEPIINAIRKSRDPRVKYIIYEKRITKKGTNLQEWEPYYGKNPHDKHAHISVHSDPRLYDDRRPWAIGERPFLFGNEPAGAGVQTDPAVERPVNQPVSDPPPAAAIDPAVDPSSQAQPSNEPAPDVKSDTAAAFGLSGSQASEVPVQVTQGGGVSRMATVVGTIGAGLAGVQGFMSGNGGMIVAAIVCGTVVLLALIFRQVILDWARLKIGGDPNKLNVR